MVDNIKNRKRWIEIVTWLLLFGFFFSLINYFQPIEFALITAAFDTISMLIVYQIAVRVMFPFFYKYKKRYLLISMAIIIILSVIFFLINHFFMPKVPEIHLKKTPVVFHYMRFFMFTSFVYFIATSISLIEHNNRLISNEKLLTEEKLETELKLLKAQINPHFIFNALNNIYSLTYMQAKNAPDSVLKLSEMLRYVFYDCSKDRVPVSMEVKYIENFNAFQQMKSEYTQNISLQIDNNANNITVAPMLFIPFIENAFKYSRIEEDKNAYVKISINKYDDTIVFQIINSIANDNKPDAGSGMGIKNVKHRLEIIYPEKHELLIDDTGEKYMVSLILNS